MSTMSSTIEGKRMITITPETQSAQAMASANMSGKTIMFTNFGKTSLRYSFILSMPSSAMAALVAVPKRCASGAPV